MKRAFITFVEVCGVMLAAVGVGYVVKWFMHEYKNKEVKERYPKEDETKVDSSHFESAYEEPAKDLNEERIDAVSEIAARHQEAAKIISEIVEEISAEKKEESVIDEEELEVEGRLNFDDIDASLDKLFDEE